MSVTCPVCKVANEVPDEAVAFRCTNCGKLIRSSGGTWSPEGQGVKVVVIAAGVVLLIFVIMWAMNANS